MKRSILAVVGLWLILASVNGYSQNLITFDLNHKDPVSVVGAIFYAAKTGDLAILNCLCDPLRENDGDTKGICELSKLASEETRDVEREEAQDIFAEFSNYFRGGKITGEVQIKLEEGQSKAEVPFWFNHPGGESRSNETMVLVKRYGNWYLLSF